ncbi:hypothetical protein HMN09_00218200 [Mycena chlorophos]|uniref:F-box domain-containing protein n=1 Tax=Mycena chlorophos TaxID=658473 RepID=A0A8H6TKK2_MYCCL|nr:hypothetical protein HMN09_00218200 [Mycena chlorophos]
MAALLPSELLDRIFGNFSLSDFYERRTIARFGLVCKSWGSASRYQLFRSVKLTERNIGSFLELVPASAFPISSVIRSLELASGGRNQEIICASIPTLGALPLIKRLRITMNEAILMDNLSMLGELFPNITELQLHASELSFATILRTTHMFKLLQSLALSWVYLTDGAPSGLSLGVHPHWHKLALDLTSMSVTQPLNDTSRTTSEHFFGFLLALDPVPVMTTLSVSAYNPGHVGHANLSRYLQRYGKNIEDLRIETQNLKFVGVDALSSCTTLKRLEIVLNLDRYTRIDDQLLKTFKNVARSCQHTLKHIAVVDMYGARPVNLEWDDLDELLATDKRFTGLELFFFQSSNSLVESMFST